MIHSTPLPATAFRLSLAAVATICFALLGYAYFLQYGPERQQPCPLCVLQRYGYFFVGLIAAIGAIHGKRVYAWGAALMSLGGIGLATWQVLKGADMTSCREDPIGVFVNGLPMADWWPAYLFANGGCADKYVTLGLPVPVWSLLCFAALTTALLYLAIRFRHKP